jgi:hypothetical protein
VEMQNGKRKAQNGGFSLSLGLLRFVILYFAVHSCATRLWYSYIRTKGKSKEIDVATCKSIITGKFLSLVWQEIQARAGADDGESGEPAHTIPEARPGTLR